MRSACLIAAFLLLCAVSASSQTGSETPRDASADTTSQSSAETADGDEEARDDGAPARPDTASQVPSHEASGDEESAAPDVGRDADEAGDPESERTVELRVLRAYVCKGIEESEPAEAGKSFLSPDGGTLRLCCFSEVEGTGRDTVLHVWYWGEREMARVPLEVRGPRWRTWSSKRIMEEWRGDWRVDITTMDGSLLERLGFSVD